MFSSLWGTIKSKFYKNGADPISQQLIHHREPDLIERSLNFCSFLLATCTIILLVYAFYLLFSVPSYYLPSFRVESATLSNFNVNGSSSSSTLLFANWDVSFRVENPNKDFGVRFNHIEAEIFYSHGYNKYLLALTHMPNFYLTGGGLNNNNNNNNVTVLASRYTVASELDEDVLGEILKERVSGSVSFDLKVSYQGRKYGERPDFDDYKVWCRNLRFDATSGSLIGGSKACEVDMARRRVHHAIECLGISQRQNLPWMCSQHQD